MSLTSSILIIMLSVFLTISIIIRRRELKLNSTLSTCSATSTFSGIYSSFGYQSISCDNTSCNLVCSPNSQCSDRGFRYASVQSGSSGTLVGLLNQTTLYALVNCSSTSLTCTGIPTTNPTEITILPGSVSLVANIQPPTGENSSHTYSCV